MQTLLRRIRGAIGMGFTWAVAWAIAGIGMNAATGFTADAPFPLVFGVFGFASGVVFSAVLALTEGRRRLDQLSLRRVAGWGAAGGLLLGLGLAKAVIGWGEVLVVAPVFALAGAACASSTLALAQRASRREVSAMGADDELPAPQPQKLI